MLGRIEKHHIFLVFILMKPCWETLEKSDYLSGYIAKQNEAISLAVPLRSILTLNYNGFIGRNTQVYPKYIPCYTIYVGILEHV